MYEKSFAVSSRHVNMASMKKARPSALLLVVPLLLFGCSEDPIIWSAESRSPDGQWTAHAHTVQHSGFGTDGVETLVELKPQSRLRATIRVLAFMNGGNSMRLQMKWTSRSHLETKQC